MFQMRLRSIFVWDFLMALILFLPTCAYFSVNFYLLFIPILIIRNRFFIASIFTEKISFIKKNINQELVIIFALVILSFLNRLIDSENISGVNHFYSNLYLLPLTYFISKLISRKILFLVLIFVGAEVLVCVYEYIVGTSSIYHDLFSFYKFETYRLLYNTRVFGLGYNSSLLAEKLVISIILLDYFYVENTYKKSIFLLVFLIGVILTFGRTIVLCSILFLLYKIILIVSTEGRKLTKPSFLYVTIAIAFILFFTHDFSFFRAQFTRGNMAITYDRIQVEDKGVNSKDRDIGAAVSSGKHSSIFGDTGVELSGRREIWSHYLNYVKDNLIFGNHSKKYMAGRYHAHNSFLQVLSTHGVIIFGGIMLLVFSNINKDNYLIILCILGLGMFQYIVFWGVSFIDFIFYYFLFFFKKVDFEN